MDNEKNDGLNISEEDLKKLEQMAKDLDAAQSDAKTEAFGKKEICEQYNKIKPILKSALPIIRLIPKFGKQVADAIEFLMGIADNFCEA